ncbi:hypothetical protein HBO32_30225 [Pseudomonas nitroreducens]|uniref:hypothetical protein n=1 Tax=Pseudomonas nitroreducens TaxID=46680 RepID=UPI001474DB42|nr:hypothetical protein [Pseudomonas nitroreducens]NMZ77377.1 hypothetical protein [Pseudomonas nitroreducens]
MSEHAKPSASNPLEAILSNQKAMIGLMESQLQAQQKTNLLIASLIEAMADDGDVVELEPRTYLSGEPIL